jgi:hypothetical protein
LRRCCVSRRVCARRHDEMKRWETFSVFVSCCSNKCARLFVLSFSLVFGV